MRKRDIRQLNEDIRQAVFDANNIPYDAPIGKHGEIMVNVNLEQYGGVKDAYYHKVHDLIDKIWDKVKWKALKNAFMLSTYDNKIFIKVGKKQFEFDAIVLK
jgi:tRNA(Arg) A34 adenosine deaminase TadA